MDYKILLSRSIAREHTLFDPDGCLGRPVSARLCNSVLIMNIQNKFDVITRIPSKMVIAICEQDSINYSTLFLSYLLYVVCIKPHSCQTKNIFPKLYHYKKQPQAANTVNMDHTYFNRLHIWGKHANLVELCLPRIVKLSYASVVVGCNTSLGWQETSVDFKRSFFSENYAIHTFNREMVCDSTVVCARPIVVLAAGRNFISAVFTPLVWFILGITIIALRKLVNLTDLRREKLLTWFIIFCSFLTPINLCLDRRARASHLILLGIFVLSNQLIFLNLIKQDMISFNVEPHSETHIKSQKSKYFEVECVANIKTWKQKLILHALTSGEALCVNELLSYEQVADLRFSVVRVMESKWSVKTSDVLRKSRLFRSIDEFGLFNPKLHRIQEDPNCSQERRKADLVFTFDKGNFTRIVREENYKRLEQHFEHRVKLGDLRSAFVFHSVVCMIWFAVFLAISAVNRQYAR